MDIQKHNQELTQPDGTLLVKVPEEFYQRWWHLLDNLNHIHTPIPEKQERLLHLMIEWARNYYPGYGIIAFEDLRSDEAQAISRKTGQNITWGMYVILQLGADSIKPISFYHRQIIKSMKQFECINTFTTQKGEYYAKGVKIYENEYYRLTSTDRSNFKEVRSDMEEFELPSSKDKLFEGFREDGHWDIPSNDREFREDIIPEAREDDHSDFDFGGGDTGGAGASDDY